MKDITFHNVTITINAKSPIDAYNQLCEALNGIGAEWMTDTYTYQDDGGLPGGTEELLKNCSITEGMSHDHQEVRSPSYSAVHV